MTTGGFIAVAAILGIAVVSEDTFGLSSSGPSLKVTRLDSVGSAIVEPASSIQVPLCEENKTSLFVRLCECCGGHSLHMPMGDGHASIYSCPHHLNPLSYCQMNSRSPAPAHGFPIVSLRYIPALCHPQVMACSMQHVPEETSSSQTL